LGGLATSTRDVVRAMDAAGYNPIIIETVGTGQAEVEVMSAAQTVLVVVAPGMGDDIQAIKAGILEIADIFVVSKADKTGADQTAAELNMLLSLTANRRQQDWHIPIIQTSSHTGQGITALADALQRHRDYLVASASLEQRAQRQARSEIQALVFQAVARALQQAVSENEWQALIRDVLSQQRDPYSIAAEIQARLGLPETQHENH
ncbi:MAG TPA: methylmalonyl Co-A mutase-associated GTPase MeaB, partial [Ktedonobacteraceae bacterium]|nr:methylmalonyl Co-A mutase-associated GTPase MeaB [Ktedonobacteraceae bacterium]